MGKTNEPAHITYGSVLDDLGFSSEKAAVLKLKAEIHSALLRRAKKYTQQQLRTILKEPQPRISEFVNGKIASVSIEKLAVYAVRLGVLPTITLRAAKVKHPKVLARGIKRIGTGRLNKAKHVAATLAAN